MLTREDNELLVRVGPGTAMGRLMRLYWIPFLFSRDVEIDGEPQRVRLLGEDLVAWRDSSGRVGSAGMWYFARRYNQPLYAWWEHAYAGASPLGTA